ncbi:FxsA family protein [Clostridium sp. D2Q-11]|uniref:FxsA family protein n=1 Tax=Anaeromonas frigoriresistens TaxID=2683708 RepID=A0A942UQL6_9FIRM|nr:FxsA family protein [Anaeromonas frigoriresistens]MBS4537393.1 FxsA family protein [Anaeromonas frigoriresistens]
MLGKLILLFTLTPIVELYILFQIAKVTSFSATLLLVLLTGIAGAYLAKSEGKIIITRIKTEINQGRMPGNELINGLCVLIGGAFLLTPGILTDVVGFSLVIPMTRTIFKAYIKSKFESMIKEGQVHFYYNRRD